MTTSACAQSGLVDLHFALRIEPAQEAELRRHLGGCDGCRDRYRRQLLLSQLDPRARSPEDRLARGLGLREAKTPRRWLAILTAGAAVAAGLALWPSADGAFTARGGAAAPSSVVVYRVSASGETRPAGAAIAPSDELAFAYRNPEGRKYLLVFAIDEHQHVYWYHPAWTDPAQDPQAVAIRRTTELVELPEAVAQKLDGQSLSLRMVLLDAPARVQDVERRLAHGVALEGNPHEERLDLEVRR
jgi:hypothetical protein